MASIHRQPGKPFWFCAFTDPEGKRRFKSTGTADKKEAEKICAGWARTAELGRSKKLTPDRARYIITDTVDDLFRATNAESLPRATLRAWCETWLSRKKVETEPTTFIRYKRVTDQFIAHLGLRAEKDLESIRTADIAGFRDHLVKNLSRSSANLAVVVLRMLFTAATKEGLLTSSPASPVDKLKLRGQSKRRPFTAAELRRVLDACGDTEWRGMVLFAIYCGARLGDIAHLTWRAVNMERGEVAFATRKTGRRMVLPLAKPLRDYLTTIPAGDDANAPLFPHAASIKFTGTLSNQFRDILVDAGLTTARGPWEGKGQDKARPVSELCFHSLRHSATTMLKSAGVSDALAREIIGHDSEVINRSYTHLSTEDLRAAVDKLPDITASTK